MLKDITIGQYFPGDSPVHRMDPRMKLVLTIAYVVLLFIANNPAALGVGVLLLAALYPIARIPLGMIVRSLRPIIPIILMTSLLNMFFTEGEILWQWWLLRVTDRGLMIGVLMSIRICALIAGTSLLTYTTSPIAITDGIEQLFGPLNRVKVPVHEVAMMMTIALRFIPTLIEETDKIMSAQKARGADLESGRLLQRVKALIPILIPLFMSAFRRAEELALAMECRCYHGGEGRTRMRVLRMGRVDVLSALLIALCIAAVVAANLYAPGLIR